MTGARLARIRTTSSPVLSALYRGNREEAERLARDRPLDLFEAAALGRSARVAEALGEAPDEARATTDDGFTALHLAAFFSGDAESARLVLDAGTDPDAPATNETGLRPINSAAAASRTRSSRCCSSGAPTSTPRGAAATRRFTRPRRTGTTIS